MDAIVEALSAAERGPRDLSAGNDAFESTYTDTHTQTQNVSC